MRRLSGRNLRVSKRLRVGRRLRVSKRLLRNTLGHHMLLVHSMRGNVGRRSNCLNRGGGIAAKLQFVRALRLLRLVVWLMLRLMLRLVLHRRLLLRLIGSTNYGRVVIRRRRGRQDLQIEDIGTMEDNKLDGCALRRHRAFRTVSVFGAKYHHVLKSHFASVRVDSVQHSFVPDLTSRDERYALSYVGERPALRCRTVGGRRRRGGARRCAWRRWRT